MEIQYLSAKNNQKTFTVDSIFYHSSYNPEREAARFLETYSFQVKKPDLIILIEPGFSYLYSPLKNKYPEAKIGILRLLPDFNDNFNWDFVINSKDIYNFLISTFNESELLNSEIIIWNQANSLFNNEILSFYEKYKEALNYAKTILTTRQYFEKKWLINSLNNFKYINSFCTINKIDLPVVITASGPSLKGAIPVLKKYRNKYFLICLSSALPVLLNNEIIPDLCMSTDGGYYANQHLKKLLKFNIPLAVGVEGYASKKLLQKNKIVLLNYSDGISSDLVCKLHIPFMSAERNGTVSGTAYKFAKELSSKEIFFCGLDLSFAKGFQHTQPNELEKNNSIIDFKLRSKETRIAAGEMNKSSLDIYKDWFSSLQNTEKIFRIINQPLNKLGNITDLSSKELEKKLSLYSDSKDFDFLENKYSDEEKASLLQKLNSFFDSELSENYLRQLFPIDYLSILHCKNIEEEEKARDNLNKKILDFQMKIGKIFECR